MSVFTYKQKVIVFIVIAFFLLVGLLSVHPARKSIPTPHLDVDFSWKVQSHHEKKNPMWLLATVSPADGYRRRGIVRATWQKMYKNDSLFETKFVISNPGELRPLIEYEQELYGDMIILEHLHETEHIANTIKSMEMLKYLVRSQNKTWDYVTKIDDDSFVNIKGFYNDYLTPVLLRKEKSPRTIIAREFFNHGRHVPAGQFYTMSWDIVKLLVDLWASNRITDDNEDTVVGRLLYEAKEQYRFVPLSNSVSFDYDDEYGTKYDNGTLSAWSGPEEDLTGFTHGVGPEAVNPHKLKSDEAYLRVAQCFDSNGIKEHPFRLKEVPEGVRAHEEDV